MDTNYLEMRMGAKVSELRVYLCLFVVKDLGGGPS
jgi:hypothetical protein